jgi:hypothetical protein
MLGLGSNRVKLVGILVCRDHSQSTYRINLYLAAPKSGQDRVDSKAIPPRVAQAREPADASIASRDGRHIALVAQWLAWAIV